MIIRKLFKFEGAHIVRDCSSDLCKKSIHGHSYLVEVFLTSTKLDNGQMIVDFGLLKGPVKEFIESFDHAWSYWNKESYAYKKFVREYSERFIEMPVSPSAEMYSLMFLYAIDKIIKNTQFNNGEGRVSCNAVRVHETATGYAESNLSDLSLWNYPLQDIIFSPGIKSRWSNPHMIEDIINNKKFINPIITCQYK